MDEQYLVLSYDADGCRGPDDGAVVARCDTLAEAREAVWRKLCVGALRSSRCWYPPDESAAPGYTIVAGYHEHPASHPEADGCGGLVIEMRDD